MKLTDAKKLFFTLRKQNRIEICEDHVIDDYPERGFSVDEVINLIKAPGKFQNTTDFHYLGERFYWRTQDIFENSVRLVIEFETNEYGKFILVISVGERT